MATKKKSEKWIQKATAKMKAKGTVADKMPYIPS